MRLDGEALVEVESFTYLDSVWTNMVEHMLTKISKARAALIQLRNVWSSKGITSHHIRIRLYSPNVKSVLHCGAEMYRTTKDTMNSIQTSFNLCPQHAIRNTILWLTSIPWGKKEIKVKF